MLATVELVAIGIDSELSVSGREGSHSFPLDEALACQPVGNDLSYVNELQTMLARKFKKRRHPGHGAVCLDDLANHPGRCEAGQSGKINRRLRVTRSLKDTARFSNQGSDMPRAAQVGGLAGRVGRHTYRPCPILSAHPAG